MGGAVIELCVEEHVAAIIDIFCVFCVLTFLSSLKMMRFFPLVYVMMIDQKQYALGYLHFL